MNTPDRQSHRRRDYDYSGPGSYFVTICAHDRRCVFGEIKDGKVLLSTLGVIVERELLLLPRRRGQWITLGPYVVMPNHVHAIITNRRGELLARRHVRSGRGAAKRAVVDAHLPGPISPGPSLESYSLGTMIGGFKSGVTREARRLGFWGDKPLWQREFWDHIVRSPKAYDRIAAYIYNNPMRWSLDRENPDAVGKDEFETWLEDEGRKAP